jgi:3',5'-cyclic-AMP phosphodiesterase
MNIPETSPQQPQQKPSCRILQLTDTHLFAEATSVLLGLPTHISLQRIVDRIAGLAPRPDLIVMTGDLSQDGSAGSYEQLSALLDPLGLPIYWLPGNHDCLDTMTRSITGPWFYPDKTFEHQGWQFILLNSQIPGQVSGRLSPSVLEDLAHQLERVTQPTTIAFHHPPVPLHVAWLDGSALQNPAEFFAVIDRFPQVKLVLFGHIHQEIRQERQGVTYLSCPSTCIQFAHDSDTFALDVERYPGFRELELFADGTWTSQVHRVDVALQPDLQSTGY